MDLLFFLQIILIILAATATLLTILSNGKRYIKMASLIVFVAIVSIAYVSFVELLGRPKPIDFTYLREEKTTSTVVSSFHKENEAIYLWVRDEGITEPTAYVLPWDLETAKQLQKAKADAEQQGTEVTLKKGEKKKTGNSEKSAWVFGVKPPESLPPKT